MPQVSHFRVGWSDFEENGKHENPKESWGILGPGASLAILGKLVEFGILGNPEKSWGTLVNPLESWGILRNHGGNPGESWGILWNPKESWGSESVEIRRKSSYNWDKIGKAVLRNPFESHGILGNQLESSGIRCGEVNVSLSERSARAKRACGATLCMPSCRPSSFDVFPPRKS